MEPIVGVFTSRTKMQQAASRLRAQGITRLSLLSPGDREQTAEGVPTDDMEQPGMGAAIGGVVGGALGVAGGLELGAAAATILIPGIGPVLAAGMIGAAVLGAGGAAAGVAAGQAMETSLAEGLPKDEVFLYEDALRQGHSVLLAVTEDQAQADMARELMAREGAESLDAARERWWIGLRPAEQEHYEDQGHDFDHDEDLYREGFVAALHPDHRGKRFEDVREELRQTHPNQSSEFAFRSGYERGYHYYGHLNRKLRD